MVDFVNILLYLPDGRLAMQRRTKDAPTDSGLLGFFGGHVDADEHPDIAVRRELAEETNLDVSALELQKVGTFEFGPEQVSKPAGERIHIYRANIPNMNFAVLEGESAESYTTDDLQKRDDVAPGVAGVIKELFGEKHGA